MKRPPLETVLRPLGFGDALPGGWILREAHAVPDDPETAALVLSRAPDVEVRIRPRSRRRCFARTASFDIVLARTAADPPAGIEAAVKRLVEAIRANDPGGLPVPVPPGPARTPGDTPRPDRAILHLVPGHIGFPDDLGGRAAVLLRRARLVLVEQAKTEVTRTLLRGCGGDPGRTRIAELPDDPEAAAREVRPLLDALGPGDEACLFGVEEGTTGLCDPGSAVVSEATRPGRRIDVRTVGGPSALAAAVSRTPIHLDAFVFLGVLENEDHVQRMARRIRLDPSLPAYLYANGRSIRERLPGLIARGGVPSRAVVTLFDRLTTPEEAVTSQPAVAYRAPPASVVPDGAPVAVLIAPDTTHSGRSRGIGRWPLGRALVRWIRSVIRQGSDTII
jgi:16S rRNA C1402 (ribose-2'-O) methylase RsmI